MTLDALRPIDAGLDDAAAVKVARRPIEYLAVWRGVGVGEGLPSERELGEAPGGAGAGGSPPGPCPPSASWPRRSVVPVRSVRLAAAARRDQRRHHHRNQQRRRVSRRSPI